MKTSKFILKAANTLVSYVVVISLCIAGLYASYALWDNSLVYAAVDDVQADMLKLKPEVRDGRPSFDELLAINSDVVGWITIDNTSMDYPIVQGETNLTYINTDIYGDFALGGSIFLDSRNDRNFNDHYSLLYGHSIINGRMFGDINLYKEEAFFNENQTGSLLTTETSYDLKIFASLIVPANEIEIFNPLVWQDDIEELVDYADHTALYLNMDIIEEMRAMDGDLLILALTTCSDEFTDARTVVLAVMEPNSTE
ncbi:MAG: class B sortase [Tissierella sp.]|nr:class B sortase [Tissierella sp.]